jgi:trypsin
VYKEEKIIQWVIIAQVMRDKTPIIPIEHLNNFIVSYQVSVPFTYGTGVQPIKMTNVEPPAGALSVVSGWGNLIEGGPIPTQLQAVEVDIISFEACNSTYADYGLMTVNKICAGVPKGGKDYCVGDTGGPLVVGGQVVGIASWGVGCAFADYPGLYSNVATLKSWVTNTTGVN